MFDRGLENIRASGVYDSILAKYAASLQSDSPQK